MYGHPGYTPGTRYRNNIAEIYANIPAILCKVGLPTCDAKTFYIDGIAPSVRVRTETTTATKPTGQLHLLEATTPDDENNLFHG
ncbi:hypothetical protein T03_3959 [Trichinella britovi]|uniref:Uncharacterized protein n=1 Tax=Trichinella britovi TaxID=45882 RepID=A0A0V1D7H8_TRIBR|nr:hypothetical protein T03_3959 [Trichinella britovi]